MPERGGRFHSRRLTIIGVGLIGGSLARAVKQAGACAEVVGCGRDARHLQQAVDLGVIDRYERDVAAAVAGADLVVVAVPLGAMAEVLRAAAAGVTPDAVITDAGSAKVSVVEAARSALGKRFADFVPGHPIAGTEKSGVAASQAGLFRGRHVILTPLPETRPEALRRVRELWTVAGAEVTEMDCGRHDRVLAATSHLPHMLAYALVDGLARLDDSAEILRYAAGGFRDFTRIASSDPVMWRDICLANRDALLEALARYGADLAALADAVRRGDGPRLMEIFARAKKVRDGMERDE